MKTLYDTLNDDIKQAMISKDNIKRDCLRMVVSDIKNLTVNAGKDITDDICLKSIQKSVKQHQDSIVSFKAGNREDLAEKEMNELKYLTVYLPKMLSNEDTVKIINELLKTIEPLKKNTGLIMKSLPKEVDKKLASNILKDILK